MPIQFNITILNSMSVTGSFKQPPIWIPGEQDHLLSMSHWLFAASPSLHPFSFLFVVFLSEVDFTWSENIYPWSGWLALRIQATPSAQFITTIAHGTVRFTVVAEDGAESTVDVPLKVAIVPTPPRSLRLLWDQFHSLRYPSGYFPRDNLDVYFLSCHVFSLCA
jgi:membrane-bound transcription factor site-1 protease